MEQRTFASQGALRGMGGSLVGSCFSMRWSWWCLGLSYRVWLSRIMRRLAMAGVRWVLP
jgi:hypothetical protein